MFHFDVDVLLPAFLSSAPKAGIDLPVKMLVWKDANGAVWITYNTGEYVMGRHGAKNAYEAARRFTSGSESFAKMAAE